MTNVINFESLRDEEGEPDFEDFLDNLKSGVYKGAYFVRKNDGTYYYGCTETDKLAQERLLYKIKTLVERYIQLTPDFTEIEETTKLLGLTEEEVIDMMMDDDE